MASQLMPSERICLKRTREQLIRSLDVTSVLPKLRAKHFFAADEEQQIMADPRRRERVVLFLNALEKKNSETFKAFCSILADQDPHLFLVVSEWDKNDGQSQSQQSNSNSNFAASRASIDDEWDVINRSRAYLVSQIDGANIVPLLKSDLLTPSESQMIVSEPVRERRTEALLDTLEMKPYGAYASFIEAVGELYPHIYLELTGSGGFDDDW